MALILTTDLKLAFFGLSKQLLDGNAHFSHLIVHNFLILIIESQNLHSNITVGSKNGML